jgi:hypothetical protein
MGYLDGRWYVSAMGHKNPSDGHLQVLIVVSIDRDCQREPGSSFLSMNNQCGRVALITINKHHDHLAIAIIGSMMWAETIGMSLTSDVQVESFHETKIGIG